MAASADLKFLEKMADKAKCIEDKLGSKDHWAKPFYSDLSVFRRGVPTIFIGLNPGGDRKSKKYYKADDSETKMRSGDIPYFNAYLDENWGSSTYNPEGRGKATLQIATKRVFETLFEDEWECILRDTPCFNLIPVSSEAPKVCRDPKRNGKSDSELKAIWHKESAWSVELLEYLKPEFIVLYDNGKTGKSVWRALEQKLYLTEDKTPIDLVPITFKLYRGVLQGGILKGVPVLGLPHLSYIHRSSKRTSKNLETLCHRLSELAAQHPFP